MYFLKLNGLVLAREKIKESDAIVYILTKNYGIIKCLARGILKSQSKNLGLVQAGNFNRFFLLTNSEKFKLISVLPLKIPNKTFYQHPYLYLWTLRLIKNLKFWETPKFVWFILTHLENYLRQNPKNFPYWFLYHLLRELGYEIDLEHCQKCGRYLKNFAFFDNKNFLYCFYCKKPSYHKIDKESLKSAKQIKNLVNIPKTIPNFLKIILKNRIKSVQSLYSLVL